MLTFFEIKNGLLKLSAGYEFWPASEIPSGNASENLVDRPRNTSDGQCRSYRPTWHCLLLCSASATRLEWGIWKKSVYINGRRPIIEKDLRIHFLQSISITSPTRHYLSLANLISTPHNKSSTIIMHYNHLIAASLVAALPAASAYKITAADVNCREGAGTDTKSVKTYAKDTDVTITCQEAGEDVFGNSLWDKTSDNCYVSDYYVRTGSNGYVEDKCDGGSGGDDGGGDDGGDDGSGDAGSGADIVDAARTQLGLPYVWGGGGCDGATKGGFDCSGLTQYAICQALNYKIPCVAQDQYDSSKGTKIPRAEAKEGDLLFWADGGNCKSAIVHVGIFIKDGLMINAARTGTPVREQDIWTSYGGQSICDYAVR